MIKTATLVFVLAFPATVFAADGAPVPPVNVKSQDECRTFQRQQNEYATRVLQQSKACSERNWKAKSNDFVTFAPSCGGVKVTAFRECQSAMDASWCAYHGFGEKYKSCMQQAVATERKPFDDAVANNEERRAKMRAELLREQCAADSVLPKSEACNAFKPSGSGFEDIQKQGEGR